MLSTILSLVQHATTFPCTAYREFKKQFLLKGFVSLHQLLICGKSLHPKTRHRCSYSAVGNNCESILFVPIMRDVLCHCSPGHFACVCVFSVSKDPITAELAYSLIHQLLLPNPTGQSFF